MYLSNQKHVQTPKPNLVASFQTEIIKMIMIVSSNFNSSENKDNILNT